MSPPSTGSRPSLRARASAAADDPMLPLDWGPPTAGARTESARDLSTPAALQRFMRADYPLSSQQFEAVGAPLAPAVVIAGAGSGKTTLMAARVAWLVGTGRVEPHQVLGLTFTTKAAAELSQRIQRVLADAGVLPDPHRARRQEDQEALGPTVATYNAYAAALLADHGLRIGHEPDSRVITDAFRYQLAARVVARHTGDVRHLSDHPQTVVNYLLALDSQLSEHLATPEQVLEIQRRMRPDAEAALAAEHRATYRARLEALLFTFDRRVELLRLVEDYRRLKHAYGLMEFSDQIEGGARLAISRPEVGRMERERFRVVLLDEYQDTSVAQARMLSHLFSGPTAGEGRGHPVMAVGDPNQAIYGWRGASVSNILRFGESFPGRDGSTAAPTYSLTVNRRSDRRILDLANTLARPLYAQLPHVRPLEAPPGAADGQVAATLFETQPEELAALPARVRAARESWGSWREIGVLTRDNVTAAAVFDALSAQEVPVEIVGLKGLLALPEVAEVVAVLTLLQDLTANPSLLVLLTGPRWAVGSRDLALLARRATQLAEVSGASRRGRVRSLGEELDDAVVEADPTEVAALVDALDDPGDEPYSREARERFALLSAELHRLRRHVGEPLLDLVRRIIDTTGLDVELASSVNPAAQARRDNLDLFVKAVADFRAVDGEVSLSALVSYLEAEDELGAGLDVATPTGADSVKLLTVHRAKGLEWDAVFLVGVAKDKFPTKQTRPKWTTSPGILPAPLRGDAGDLPVLRGVDAQALKDYAEDTRAHELREELRLAYVAFTRARHELDISAYVWADRKTPCGPSPFLETARDFLHGLGGPDPSWGAVGWPVERGAVNPLLASPAWAAWPPAAGGAEVRRREKLAARVREELARGPAVPADPADGPELDAGLDDAGRELVATWDAEIDRLLAEASEARSGQVEVALPSSLSATALAALEASPTAYAEMLARPMPRPPSPAARFGTRFHAWLERRFAPSRQELLLDPDDLAGRADLEVSGDAELRDLVSRFEAGPFGDRAAEAVEVPFALVFAGQVVRGRIDAVFADGGGFLVVDWKTHRQHTADPLQLAVYRVAWAELRGIPVEQVRAGFYYVRDAELIVYPDLPGRAELERLLRVPGEHP